jgi:peptidoglycan/LPS O-acetylase OafA/YrhL
MSNIRALTGLRGIVAALVAWGHLHRQFPTPTPISLWVDLFFVLSGFVFSLAYISWRLVKEPCRKASKNIIKNRLKVNNAQA